MATLTLEQALQLGDQHFQAGRVAEAQLVFQRVLEAAPNNAAALAAMANLVLREGDPAQAVKLLDTAIQSEPRSPTLRSRRGFALLGIQHVTEAAAAFQSAIDLDPNFSAAHYGLSWTQLLQGDFARGWVEHEWRAQVKTLPGNVRDFKQPRWDGSDLNGRTILLYQEQGLGDVIQYVRYAPMVAARGGRVVLGCSSQLASLLRTTPGIAEIAPSPHNLPPFDVHMSLHSLPLIFGTTLETIPADVPYVFPDAAVVERWRKRVDRSAAKLHVGICWAGNPKHENDRFRSIDPALLAHLAGVRNVRFYAIQKYLSAENARRLPANLNLLDWGPDIRDFTDAAAAVSSLDLVLSVDTSIAHLAGALNRPVWTLLPFHPDWRWLQHREDSPWYPSMRLFRQQRLHDWPGVLTRVAVELQRMAGQ